MSGKSQEFIVVYNIHKEEPIPILNSEGQIEGFKPNLKVVKRNVKVKWTCNDVRNISDWRQTTNKYGKVRKNYCEIFNKSDNTWLTVYHTYKELNDRLRVKSNNRFTIKGFLNRD